MLSISVLGSGSHGNCTAVWDDERVILIDAGLTLAQTKKRLESLGQGVHRVDAIVLSHEHGDHCQYALMVAREARCPVFVSGQTIAASAGRERLRWMGENTGVSQFDPAERLIFGKLEIEPFPIPHDAAAPLGFTVRRDGLKFTVALDIGHVSAEVEQAFSGAECIVFDANHDLGLLEACTRPESVKVRTRSDVGHLSNRQVEEFIREKFDGIAQVLIPAHVSEENNGTGIVRAVVKNALRKRGFDWVGVCVSEKAKPTEVFAL